MCYQAKCEKCSKTTWQGCGRHVASVHKKIPEGQHCMCKDWPGVSTEKKELGEGGGGGGGGSGSGKPETSTCTII